MSRLSGGRSAEPSQRQLRVGELVRHALADVLARREVDDPVLATAIISVSEVRVTADLRHATVYAAPMLAGTDQGGETARGIIDALNRNARYLRGRVGPALRQMKSLPDLRFRLDTRFEDDSRIDALLRKPEVARDLAAGTTPDADGAAPGGGERR